MSLNERGQSYLSRGFKMILMFAVLGCVVLIIAINYITKVFTDAIPSDPSAVTQSSSQSGTGR